MCPIATLSSRFSVFGFLICLSKSLWLNVALNSALVFIYFLFLLYFTLQYCIGFAIHWHESTTGVYKLPILNPPPTPYHLSGSSPCTSPKHPVSCIEHRLALRFLHDSIHVSMPFSQIIPPSPSPSESKSLFCKETQMLWSLIVGLPQGLSSLHMNSNLLMTRSLPCCHTFGMLGASPPAPCKSLASLAPPKLFLLVFAWLIPGYPSKFPLHCHSFRLPRWLSGREPSCQYRRCRRHGFSFWVGKIPWKRKWQPVPVFLPGKSHGQRHLLREIISAWQIQMRNLAIFL